MDRVIKNNVYFVRVQDIHLYRYLIDIKYFLSWKEEKKPKICHLSDGRFVCPPFVRLIIKHLPWIQSVFSFLTLLFVIYSFCCFHLFFLFFLFILNPVRSTTLVNTNELYYIKDNSESRGCGQGCYWYKPCDVSRHVTLPPQPMVRSGFIPE